MTQTADTHDLLIRSLPTDAAKALREGAGARGLSHAQYLARLIQLAEHARASREPAVLALLAGLGLERVSR